MHRIILNKNFRHIDKFVVWPIARLCITSLLVEILCVLFDWISKHRLELWVFGANMPNAFYFAWLGTYAIEWFKPFARISTGKSNSLWLILFFVLAWITSLLPLFLIGALFSPRTVVDIVALMALTLIPVGILGTVASGYLGRQQRQRLESSYDKRGKSENRQVNSVAKKN